MRALVFDGSPSIQELSTPLRAPGEALIRVSLAGICNTDIEILKGYMGFSGTLGHEFVGRVENADDPALIGKRVVGEINCSCHQCRYCQLELPNHCADRTVLGILNRDGAFAEFLTLPEENLHVVPDSVPDEIAVFTEPVAAACRILEQVTVESDARVVVMGAGKLGQLIAQVLRAETSQVLCIDRHPWKLAMLHRYDIQTALESDPVQRGADVVVEVTGSYEGFQRALELVRPEGTVVLKTTVAHPTAFDLSVPVIDEIRIIGSRCGPFRTALDALDSGRVDVSQMVSEARPLSEGLEALERARAKDVLKVVLAP